MSKRTTFTTTTALPPRMTRRAATAFLHDHPSLIKLNPLVTNVTLMQLPPAHAAADEYTCTWYSITDRIPLVPGVRAASSSVTYSTAFLDLPAGVQTHSYAPLGVDLRSRWTICGNEPGEPPVPVELGLLDAPRTGLYLREDTDLRCSFAMAAFVKKTLKGSHKSLVEALKRRGEEQADAAEESRKWNTAGSGNGLGAAANTVAARDRDWDAKKQSRDTGAGAGEYPWNVDARHSAGHRTSTATTQHSSGACGRDAYESRKYYDFDAGRSSGGPGLATGGGGLSTQNCPE